MKCLCRKRLKPRLFVLRLSYVGKSHSSKESYRLDLTGSSCAVSSSRDAEQIQWLAAWKQSNDQSQGSHGEKGNMVSTCQVGVSAGFEGRWFLAGYWTFMLYQLGNVVQWLISLAKIPSFCLDRAKTWWIGRLRECGKSRFGHLIG